MRAGISTAAKFMFGLNCRVKGRLVILTDGDWNTGGDPEPVAERLKADGIQIDIIGIGGSPEEVNEPCLKRMASVVDGELRYWFIDSVGELVRRFETLALRKVNLMSGATHKRRLSVKGGSANHLSPAPGWGGGAGKP